VKKQRDNSKQRLIEVFSKLDKSFKPKLNESTIDDKYEDVVFIQGEEAQEPLDILDNEGPDAALEYLKQWHDPGHHMGREDLGHGTSDETYEKDGYIMSWNSRLGYIGLIYDLSYMDEGRTNIAEKSTNESEYHADQVGNVLSDDSQYGFLIKIKSGAGNKETKWMTIPIDAVKKILEVLRTIDEGIEESEMNEIFGWSQKEKDSKALEQKKSTGKTRNSKL
jgi:hypothetical protein